MQRIKAGDRAEPPAGARGSAHPPPLDFMLALSRRMLECAEQGAWATLAELEAQRRPLIETFFSDPIAAHRPNAAAAVRALLAIDERTMALAASRRRELADVLRGIHLGKRALRAYRECG